MNIVKVVLDFYRQAAKSEKYADLHKVLERVHWLSELEDAWKDGDEKRVIHLFQNHQREIILALTWALDELAKAGPV